MFFSFRCFKKKTQKKKSCVYVEILKQKKNVINIIIICREGKNL